MNDVKIAENLQKELIVDTIQHEKPSKESSKETNKTTKSDRQEMYLPVHKFVWFYPEEIKVINHPAFQRLSRINQLGQTNLVYRGATHKRIEHVLGTVHIIQKMIEAIEHNSEKREPTDIYFAEALDENEQRFVRLGALLHDIGHLAAGHTLEDELGLIDQHDGDDRLKKVFEYDEWFEFDSCKTLQEVVDEQYAKYVPSDICNKVSPTEITKYLIRKEEKIETTTSKERNILSKSSSLRVAVLRPMIGDTICADLLDYIQRDFYHLGKPKEADQRILQYMEIRPSPNNGNGKITKSRRNFDDHFVISLGEKPKLRTDGISAILEFLEWRYQLAEMALFHRTKLAAASMLDRALYDLWENSTSKKIVSDILKLSDEQLIEHCIGETLKKLPKKPTKNFSAFDHPRAYSALQNFERLKHRQLHIGIRTFFYSDFDNNEEQRADVKLAFDAAENVKSDKNLNTSASKRAEVLRNLEEDFEFEPGTLTMYCGSMPAKLGDVKVCINNRIGILSELEKDNDGKYTGRHLRAQLRRFERLWRVHFFMEREAFNKLDEQGLVNLREAIDHMVLGLPMTNGTENPAEKIANDLAINKNFSYYGHTPEYTVPQPSPAHSKLGKLHNSYLNGHHNIRDYFKEVKSPYDTRTEATR